MAINNRGILGPINPYDNHLQPASRVDGDEPVASRDDQASSLIGAHGDLTATFKSTYARHSGGVQFGAGSEGVALGASDADNGFSTSQGDGGPGDLDGDAPAFGGGGSPAKGIAGTDSLVTRGDGGDSGVDGTGRTVG